MLEDALVVDEGSAFSVDCVLSVVATGVAPAVELVTGDVESVAGALVGPLSISLLSVEQEAT